MSLAAHIALLGWIPLVLVLFALTTPRRAALIAFVSGTLFLPVAGYAVTGFKSKLPITCLGILIASLIFTPGRWARFRLTLGDLPMLVFCLWPFVSSNANGLGYYESFAAVFDSLESFGVPYLIGRIYFDDLRGLRELAIGIFVGGLVYTPLCLWEIRLSPQLHRLLYGFAQHDFASTVRFGGYRPMVFMDHGLAVGMWMTAASLLGCLLWQSGSLRSLWRIPVGMLLSVLLVTTVLCKSFGALALLVIGLSMNALGRRYRTVIPILVLVVAAPLYLGLRISGTWSGESLAVASAQVGSEERADSLRFRLQNEELLIARALQRALTGWGRWGRFLLHDDEGKQLSIPDGLWVIMMGQFGLVGLAALTSSLVLPVILLLRRYPVRSWNHPLVAPAGGLAVFLVLHMIDNLFNSMVNPVYLLAAGGVIGVCRRPVLVGSPRLVSRWAGRSAGSRMAGSRRRQCRSEESVVA